MPNLTIKRQTISSKLKGFLPKLKDLFPKLKNLGNPLGNKKNGEKVSLSYFPDISVRFFSDQFSANTFLILLKP